jgi:hypothetical protein
VREQSTLGVRNAPFRRANTAATVEDFALGPNLAGLQGNSADERLSV